MIKVQIEATAVFFRYKCKSQNDFEAAATNLTN